MEHILPFAQTYDMLPRQGLILCALSGGGDSVALLHFLKSQGFQVAAAHFDHHLRPTSGDDARLAQALCRELEVPFYLGEGKVGEMPGNTEANARTARYDFLERTAQAVGAARIVTAHNANDNLETVLLHLTRGCGLRGLSGIQPRRGKLARPMLHTTRAAIETYLSAHGLPYATDETNADTQYSRNRLRHQVVPVLETINPRAVEAAVRMTDRLREDAARLEPWTPPAAQRVYPPLETRTVTVGERVDTPLWSLETSRALCPQTPPTPEAFYLRDTEGLTLRQRQTGDYLHPPFRRGKTVKKWMIELGIPRGERQATPVLASGDTILSVAGVGPQADCLARPGEVGIFVRWIKQIKQEGER